MRGDAIMAAFGLPITHDDDEDRAVRAAIAMIRGCWQWSEERVKRGEKPLDFGKEEKPFKALAMKAMERIPETVDLSEPETALYFFRAKTELGFMYYPLQQYDKMEQLATKLLPLVPYIFLVPG